MGCHRPGRTFGGTGPAAESVIKVSRSFGNRRAFVRPCGSGRSWTRGESRKCWSRNSPASIGPLQMQTSHEGPRGLVRLGLALRYAGTNSRDSMTQRGESVGWPCPRLGLSCDSGPTDEDGKSRTMANGRGQRGGQPGCRSPRGLDSVGSGPALELVPKCGRSADRKCHDDAWFRVVIGQVDLGEFQPRDGLQACGRGRDREGRRSAMPGAAKWAKWA